MTQESFPSSEVPATPEAPFQTFGFETMPSGGVVEGKRLSADFAGILTDQISAYYRTKVVPGRDIVASPNFWEFSGDGAEQDVLKAQEVVNATIGYGRYTGYGSMVVRGVIADMRRPADAPPPYQLIVFAEDTPDQDTSPITMDARVSAMAAETNEVFVHNHVPMELPVPPAPEQNPYV